MTDQISIDISKKIDEHLPDGSDPIVLVLKAHLLLEEQLINLTEEIAPQACSLSHAKLSFPQRVYILQSFIPIIIPDIFFRSALLLNTIRNRMAHQLSPKDLAYLERDFIQLISDEVSKIPGLSLADTNIHHERFRSALVILIVVFSSARSALPVILASKKRNPSAV